MSNQQILLLLLGTIIVTIAIAIGITMVKEQYHDSLADQIQHDITLQAQDAKLFHSKPSILAGGNGSFEGYTLLPSLAKADYATYSINVVAAIDIHSTNSNRHEFIVIKAQIADGLAMAIVGETNGSLFITWNGTGSLKRLTAPKVIF